MSSTVDPLLYAVAPSFDLDDPPFTADQELRFRYPRANYHGVATALEARRIRVTELRDLVAAPLDPQTGELDPLLRRDRWLVVGIDLDLGEQRSFYLGSMCDIIS